MIPTPAIEARSAAAVSYRPDIDGLRALAVLAVIGYHFYPESLRAGFVGVDIFFVISGYLISGIILGQAQAGAFSLAGFYGRRIRRIFPALALVLLASLSLGWLVLYAEEFRQLGRHVASGAGFVSNFLLWSETGYFDAAAETKPLLHLWSLAIEEQFYLLWPLIIVYLCRGKLLRLRTTALLLVASLAASVAVGAFSQPAGFYLPLTRFWELMAGALLAQWHPSAPLSQRGADLRSAAGLALLAAAFAMIQPGQPFPGWRALLPVAGTCLLIAAGPTARINRWLLSNRAMVAIGLISYPLYLWHWPLLAYWRILANGAPLPPASAAILLLGSIALAWMTYAWLERPVRTGGAHGFKGAALASLMLAVGVAGWTVAARNGFPARAVNDRDPTFHARDGRNAKDVQAWLVEDCRVGAQRAQIFRRCTRDGRGTERYALLGDSKAEALFSGLVRTSSPEGRWLFIGGSTQHDSVLPVLSAFDRYSSYEKPSRAALEAVRDNPNVEVVVLVAAARAFFFLGSDSSIEELPASPYYPQAHEGLSRYARELVDAGKRVVLVVDNPTLPDPKRCMHDARVTVPQPLADLLSIGKPDPRCSIPLSRHHELSAIYRRLLLQVSQIAPERIAIFDPLPELCDTRSGLCGAFEDGKHLYSFSDHISDYAATKVGRSLNGFLAAGPAAHPGAAAPAAASRAPVRSP